MTVQSSAQAARIPLRHVRWLSGSLAALVVWAALYSQLVPFSQWAVSALRVDPQSRRGEAIAFFLYDAPKVLLLLTLVVFAMGVLRSFFSAERTRALLDGKREGIGNVLAACLGIVTPFCSCSAVPLFIGFMSAGVPLGVTFSFLIAAPMVNEVALGLLFRPLGLEGCADLSRVRARSRHRRRLGDRTAAFGALAGRLGAECASGAAEIPSGQFELKSGLDAVRDIVGRVWPWMLAGIAAGAHPWLRPGRTPGINHGARRVVVSSGGRRHRHPDVF